MRPSVAKDLPGETIWQHISDHYDWEDYLGKGGMRELEKSLKKMKRVKPQQLDQMLPVYIPADEVYDIFRNSLAIGHQPNENFKDKLKQIVREELESLTALSERKIKGKAVGNFLKKGRAGRTLTMKGKKYTDLGKGKWKSPDNKKLDWIELSSMASALGDEMVTLDEQNTWKCFYRRKSTNDDSAFEFSTSNWI